MSAVLPNGYAVYRNVLAPATLSGLRDAITETIDRTARALRAPFEESAPDARFEQRLERIAVRDAAYANALFHAVMADAHRDPRLGRLAAERSLSERVAETLCPLRVTGQVIRPRAAVASLSHAGSPWHQDVLQPSAAPGSCGSVRLACWIPLTDVDEQTGALEVIPGAWPEPLPHATNGAGQLHVDEDRLPLDARRAIPLLAGDVLVLDRFVPHRSLPVRAGCVRWAIVMWVKASPREKEG
jgi:ectoine hydroxylase-related dioxygenase (phytanoyl-CoA dioxygenase family)